MTTDRLHENFKINQTHLLLLLNLKKKNSAKFISSPNMSCQTTRIVTKLFSWAHTQSLSFSLSLFSLSHVLYLNTPSQLFVLRLLFVFGFWKNLFVFGCSATEETHLQRNPGWSHPANPFHSLSVFLYQNEGSRKMYVNSTPWNWALAVVLKPTTQQRKSMSPKRQNHHKVCVCVYSTTIWHGVELL